MCICASDYALSFDRSMYFVLGSDKVTGKSAETVVEIWKAITPNDHDRKAKLTLQPALHQFDYYNTIYDFLIQCKVGHSSCRIEYFSDVWMPGEGNCLLINLVQTPGHTTNVDFQASYENGLLLVMQPINLYPSGKFFKLWKSKEIHQRGVFVSVAPEGHYPRLDSPVLVSRQTFLRAEVKEIESKQEKMRHKHCLESPEPMATLGFNNTRRTWLYSRELCVMLAKQDSIISKCGCYSELLPRRENHSNIMGCHSLDYETTMLLVDIKQQQSLNITEIKESLRKTSSCHDKMTSSYNVRNAPCLIRCERKIYRLNTFTSESQVYSGKQ